ncbi:heavy metal transporter [Flavobacterium sediminis]|uniref:Heavy metal transporter n=2 Tax=Flavobacterium sediminis TaxID=2201181 RepID=A0A2U8QZ24_9FLAO|nr:heavy metal transporter [Flavobacterium sediminis]
MSDNHTKYACPMKCEGDKTYDEAGSCPKCGMDLEAVEAHDHSEMNHEEGHDHGNSESTEREITQNNSKNTATSAILDAYFEIKNGLVADSKEKTANGGNSLLTAISKFDMSKLSGETHKEYMEIAESAKEHAEHIVKSPIDHQREHFEALSIDITDIVALLGTDKVVYQDFCPMANNNKGASWLSEVKEIKNPYFGSKMLKCGTIKKQIN